MEQGGELQSRRRFGLAWLALVGALAVHVVDEATHDFLSVYNPTVASIRERFPWLPLPTFQFDVWLGGLILAVLLLAGLSSQAFAGKRWMRPLARVFGVLMFLNGMGHFAGSIRMGQMMPGVYSSPLLLGASIWLLLSTRSHLWDTTMRFSRQASSEK